MYPLEAPAFSGNAIDEAADILEVELGGPMGRDDRVAAACEVVRAGRDSWLHPGSLGRFVRLASLASRRAGRAAECVATLLLELAGVLPDPWAILEPLLAAPVARVALATLELAVRLLESGRLNVDAARAGRLAELVEAPASPFLERPSLERVAILLRRLEPRGDPRSRGSLDPPAPPTGDPGATISRLYVEAGEPCLRRLAARVLDLSGTPPSAGVTSRVLGEEAASFLRAYLSYTRATHLDLLDLSPEPGRRPAALTSIRRAEEVCGEPLLREVLAALGWSRVNVGLTVQPYVGVSVGGSFPLLLRPAEAALFAEEPSARRVFERWLVVAHGGPGGHGPDVQADGQDPVSRFRALNLLHADALGDILDVAPLTVEKVRRILARMDLIVSEFCGLFTARAADECLVVADVHRRLKERVERELASASGRPISAEVTRLVQMFEDPRTPGEVRTVHGLKRFLHQRGLRLGFRLAEAGRGTNRTVDLAIVEPPRVTHVARAVEYVDFEPGEGAGIPWPVWIAADGFARQLLHGPLTLPKLRAFCYGNEVHYFLAFGNHPLFLRVDFAPPLRGGMLDLEYYGVSKHELNVHPNPSLDGVGRFFRRLDIGVEIEATRIHARYDKERAVDMADLCAKVEAIFRLAPYLMDIDWIIGDLALPAAARRAVAEAWADSFARRGVLPVSQLLTADRLGILQSVEADAAGPREVRWSGQSPYRDRFTPPAGPTMEGGPRGRLCATLAARGLPELPVGAGESPLEPLELERELLGELRAALERGELREERGTLVRCPPELFERDHEASWLAGLILGGADEDVERSARVGQLAAALERHLRFQTSGSVNGYEVQRAELPLRGEVLTLFVLRDAAGVARLGCFSLDRSLYRTRAAPHLPWRASARLDVEGLAARLRSSNLPVTCEGSEPAAPSDGPTTASPASSRAAGLRAAFRTPNLHAAPPRLPGERLVTGIPAAPGRAAGLACLGVEGRGPEDLSDAILIAASVRPDDAPLLQRSAGVVSTGGGVLSHAGLLAMQLGKPALVAGGAWGAAPGGSPFLACRRTEYAEFPRQVGSLSVVEHHDVSELEDRILEGDLVVVDADAGLLRLLGQHHDAIALHEGLRLLVSASRRLSGAASDAETLELRGRRIRARHQLERLLARMEDPVLARHAARELFVGEAASGRDAPALLRELLANAAVGDAARAAVRRIASDLARRHAAARGEALRVLPSSTDAHEMLTVRRDLLRLSERHSLATSCLVACSLTADAAGDAFPEAPAAASTGTDRDVEALAVERLSVLRRRLVHRLNTDPAADASVSSLRHVLSQVERLDSVLPARSIGPAERSRLEDLRRRLAADDEASRARLADRLVVRASDGGAELQPIVGSKAAGLAEAARIGEGARIPAWFVVTDRAFHEVFDARGQDGRPPLRDVVDGILSRDDLGPEAKSDLIRRAWQSAPLPAALASAVAQAYGALEGPPEPFVAVRSSAREEDTEAAARAGEFDTFLFVCGVPSLLDHLRLAWAGLWTARAIQGRQALHSLSGPIGGGVLVQRMVDARVSGVLHTANVASGRPREMLINAGLGLGEGVVSGLVAADQITVEKGATLAAAGADGVGESVLHVRYITRDKRERVVFSTRRGTGTARVETLYHQRLRPALEYVELCELVHAAARLEAAWGHPLDIEFALEGSRLFLLQVRPVPAALAVWRETAERYPLPQGELP